MITLVTYSDASCSISKKVCCDAALKNGVDVIRPESPETVSQEFKEINNDVWGKTRGASFWIWKPYIVNRAMQRSNDEDFVIYCDAGCELINNVSHIINAMVGDSKDIFLFSNGHQHIHWCKSDIVKAIIHADTLPDYHQQVQASLLFFRVNDYTRRFVKEWLIYSQLPRLIDDSPSIIPNHPEFAENRYDQAILGTLAIRDKLPLHWWPDKLWYENQRYRWPEDKYPSMVLHHRKRDPGAVTNPEGPTW